MEECFAIKRNGVLIYTICNMNKLSNHYTKWKKTQKATYFMISSIRNVQIHKFIDTERRLRAGQDLSRKGLWLEQIANGYRVSAWGDGNVLELHSGMVGQHTEYTKSQRIYFNMENFMLYELYHNFKKKNTT